MSTPVTGDGFILAPIEVNPSEGPTGVTVRIVRRGDPAGRSSHPIEAIIAGIVVNKDVHTATRLVDSSEGTSQIWVKALRFSSEPFDGDPPPRTRRPAPALVRISGLGSSRGTMFDVPPRLQPTDGPARALWFRPFTVHDVALGRLQPGVYPMTVEVSSSRDTPFFNRIHRFQFFVDEGVAQRSGPDPQGSATESHAAPLSNVPVTRCPAKSSPSQEKAPRKRKKKSARR
jgi:hypothetical protein